MLPCIKASVNGSMDRPAAEDNMGLPAVFVKECLTGPEAGIEWQVDLSVDER